MRGRRATAGGRRPSWQHAAALALALVAACTSTSLPGRNPDGQALDADDLRQRPLQLPKLPLDERCPVTTDVSRPSADLGPLLGTSLARPVLDSPTLRLAPAENFDSLSWKGQKVLWALTTASPGVVLLRGQRVGAADELRFDGGAEPVSEKVLDPAGRRELDGGWVDFPSYLRVKSSGCFAIQIDSAETSSTVVLEFVD